MVGTRPQRMPPTRPPLPPVGHRGGDAGGASLPPQGRGEGSGPRRTQAPAFSLGPPSSPLAWGQVNWRLKGRWPGSASHLTPPGDNHHATNCRPNCPLRSLRGRCSLGGETHSGTNQWLSEDTSCLHDCCLATGYGLLACSNGRVLRLCGPARHYHNAGLLLLPVHSRSSLVRLSGLRPWQAA